MRIKARLAGIALGLGISLVVLVPGVAGAQSPYVGGTPPHAPNGPGVPSAAGQAPKVPRPSGGLPFTGADIAEMSIIGIAAVGAGSALIYRSRRRRSVAA